jgi:hypothetical protein
LPILYLNTDLDLIAACDLTPLASALDARGVFPLHVTLGGGDLWYSTLEVSTDVEPREPEATIRIMLDAIESIDGEAKHIWQACSTREFNIGYDCGDEPWAFNNGLTNSTLQRMASVGATLRITLYPPAPSRPENPGDSKTES